MLKGCDEMFRLAAAFDRLVRWRNAVEQRGRFVDRSGWPQRAGLPWGLFSRHGLGAPGEHLFRALRFKTKALTISAARPGGATAWHNGVAQVGTAMGDLDRMPPQNAALVEQTATAASALKDQVVGLASEVARSGVPVGQY